MAVVPTLRVARLTEDIDALLPFYCGGLGLAVLFRFENHDGFDGIMLGAEAAPYHFEFCRAHGHPALPREVLAASDNLLVFYLPDEAEWRAAVARMQAAGFASVASLNPYWDRAGRTFEDPDGYRVVLQNAAWTR